MEMDGETFYGRHTAQHQLQQSKIKVHHHNVKDKFCDS